MSHLSLSSHDRAHTVPPKTGVIGMALFLVSLAMLFAAGMLAYVVIRTTGDNRPEAGTVYVPAILWFSTLLLIAASTVVHLAYRAARRGNQALLKRCLVVTLVLSGLFLLVQTPGLMDLYDAYQPKRQAFQADWEQARRAAQESGRPVVNADTGARYPQEMHVIGLIVVHALHVVGGLIPLAIVTRGAFKNRYPPDNAGPIRFTAWYWHFLDVVWVAMLLLIVFTA